MGIGHCGQERLSCGSAVADRGWLLHLEQARSGWPLIATDLSRPRFGGVFLRTPPCRQVASSAGPARATAKGIGNSGAQTNNFVLLTVGVLPALSLAT